MPEKSDERDERVDERVVRMKREEGPSQRTAIVKKTKDKMCVGSSDSSTE